MRSSKTKTAKRNKAYSAILHTAKIKLPVSFAESDIQSLSEFMSSFGDSLSIHKDQNAWILELFSQDIFDPELLNSALITGADLYSLNIDNVSWMIGDVPETDWLAQSYRQFPAFSVGPFFIYGSHHDGDVPDGLIGLQIDAATAFGSGEHGTTKGCLLAMLDLKARGVCPWNVVDMGTGSGILGIAAWKLWKTPVLAVDNDKEAVRVADHHRSINNVPSGSTGVLCKHSEGFSTDIVQEKKPFDMIIANILAGPLKEMAGDLAAASDENGYVVLSGILNTQADDVIDVYEKQGFTVKNRYEIAEWSTLVLHNAAT